MNGKAKGAEYFAPRDKPKERGPGKHKKSLSQNQKNVK